jgi:hypothetical protein
MRHINVIPCSLSATKPSVANENLNNHILLLATFSIASFICSQRFVSYNNLPIKVLFPSSTLPAVAILKLPFILFKV